MPIKAAWSRVVEFRVPGATNADFRAVGKEAGVFFVVDGGRPSRCYRWLGGKPLAVPGERLDNVELDLFAGLLTTVVPTGGNRVSLATLDVRSGRVLSRVDAPKGGSFQRYGHTLHVQDRLFDATTGKPTSDTGMGTLAYTLDGGWVGFGRHKGTTPPPPPYKGFLQRWSPNQGLQETPAGKYDQTYSGIVGHPDGPFAIPYEPVGSAHGDADLITRSFKTLPVRPEIVYDASDMGFLVTALNRNNPNNAGANPGKFDLLCLDPKTGRILWRREPYRDVYARVQWCGPYVLGGDKGFEALDGRTGRTLGTIVPPLSATYVGEGRFLSVAPKTGAVTLWRLSLKHF